MPSGGYLRYGRKIGLKFQSKQRIEALLKRRPRKGVAKKMSQHFPLLPLTKPQCVVLETTKV